MKNLPVYLILLAVLVIGGFFVFSRGSQENASVPVKTTENTTTEKTVTEEKKAPVARYVPYSQSTFDAAYDKKRVYFFHAAWCPTCKVANEEFTQMTDQIPADVMLFKTDYDSEKDLKKQYNITYQHTFVYVDTAGREIKKWNGGKLQELIANTQ